MKITKLPFKLSLPQIIEFYVNCKINLDINIHTSSNKDIISRFILKVLQIFDNNR